MLNTLSLSGITSNVRTVAMFVIFDIQRTMHTKLVGVFMLYLRINFHTGMRGLFPWGYSVRGVKLTTHLYLVSRLRMNGAIPPLPQYVFMEWYLVKHWDNFTFTFTFHGVSY